MQVMGPRTTARRTPQAEVHAGDGADDNAMDGAAEEAHTGGCACKGLNHVKGMRVLIEDGGLEYRVCIHTMDAGNDRF
jgi:hypothetical protein